MPGSSPDTWKFGGGSVLTGYILVQMEVVLARKAEQDIIQKAGIWGADNISAGEQINIYLDVCVYTCMHWARR